MCGLDHLAEVAVLLRIELFRIVAPAVNGGKEFVDQFPEFLRSGHEGGDLLLLLDLPVDELLDVRVIHIEADHLRGAARGAARLDRAGSGVADLEEGHQPGGNPAARKRFGVTPQVGEVRSRSGAVLEEPRLTGPQVHDATFAHQVVTHGLNETRMRLRMRVGILGARDLARYGINVVVALCGAGKAVGPTVSGVEPLRRIRRGHLVGQHVAQLVVKRLGVRFGVEVVVLEAPVGPAAGKPMEDLAGIRFGGGALVGRKFGLLGLIGKRGLKPGRDALFLGGFAVLGDACFAEILLGHDVRGHLRPLLGHHHLVPLGNHGSVGIADHRLAGFKLQSLIRTFTLRGEASLDFHGCISVKK